MIRMKYALPIFLVSIIAALIVYVLVGSGKPKEPPVVTSFEDCAAAGYPVAESHPRQCRTPNGLVYAEELHVDAVYRNASASDVAIEVPFPGGVVGKQFSVVGQARGIWYSEGVFPVLLVAPDGTVLAQAQAQAQGEWMTEGLVPFRADLSAPQEYIGPASLILSRDNPSGVPENDASVTVPLTVEY